jgi:co-chaperonin GroES (HSP10)
MKHEFEGLQAVNDWIVCEQTDTRKRTRGGLVVPEGSRMVVWCVYSVGEKVTCCKAGDRLLFLQPTGGQHTVDGRTFAILRADQVIATLAMPDPDEPVLLAPDGKPAVVLQ